MLEFNVKKTSETSTFCFCVYWPQIYFPGLNTSEARTDSVQSAKIHEVCESETCLRYNISVCAFQKNFLESVKHAISWSPRRKQIPPSFHLLICALDPHCGCHHYPEVIESVHYLIYPGCQHWVLRIQKATTVHGALAKISKNCLRLSNR